MFRPPAAVPLGFPAARSPFPPSDSAKCTFCSTPGPVPGSFRLPGAPDHRTRRAKTRNSAIRQALPAIFAGFRRILSSRGLQSVVCGACGSRRIGAERQSSLPECSGVVPKLHTDLKTELHGLLCEPLDQSGVILGQMDAPGLCLLLRGGICADMSLVDHAADAARSFIGGSVAEFACFTVQSGVTS